MSNQHKGVGLNLRLEYIDEIILVKPRVSVLEIIVENWFSEGPHHQKLEKLRADYDLSFHCVGMNIAGESSLNRAHIKKVKDLKDRYRPIHVSDHLCMTAHKGVQHHDLLPIPFNTKYLKNSIQRILEVQDLMGEEILLENLSYYIEYKESEMSEIDFFNEIFKETNSNLLLDLNNIWVNSKNLRIDLKKEIKKVDWQKVSEIHLAGPELRKGIFVDTHGSSIHSEVYHLLQEVKDEIQSIPIIYERDNNLVDLKSLMEEVRKIESVLS